MRRQVTWLLVAVVAGLGVVATVDALRGTPEPGLPATTLEDSGAPVANASGLDGILYYTGRDDCVLRGVRLPELDEAPVPRWRDCQFSLSPDRIEVAAYGTAWERRGGVRAVAGTGGVSVISETGDSVVIEATAPAFTRFGNLTFARDGAVLVADPECLLAQEGGLEPCARVAVRAGDLRRVVSEHTNLPDGPGFGGVHELTVKEAVWLDADRLALILAAEIRFVGRFEALVLFDGSRNLRIVEGGLNAGVSDLAASPGGGYVAVSTASSPGLALFDRNGDAITLPTLREPHAITWSPGESWAAIATRASVFVFRAGRPDLDVHRLPLAAADLAWR